MDLLSITTIVLGVLGCVFLITKRIAPKTETKWDDHLVDVIEGISETVGVDPDEAAKRSAGKLKKRIIRKIGESK